MRLVGLLAAGIVLAPTGCDGSDNDKPRPSARAKPQALGPAEVGKVAAGMPKERVLDELGPPVVAQGPTSDYAGGCLFYPVENVPLTSVWQFCFDAAGLTFMTTAAAQGHPRVSRYVPPAQQVVVVRGDTLCQSRYGYLTQITARATRARRAVERRDTPAARRAVGEQIRRFAANLEKIHAELSAFEDSADEGGYLRVYLKTVKSQIDALGLARAAYEAGDDQEYGERIARLDELSASAREQARTYGFSTCGGARWRA